MTGWSRGLPHLRQNIITDAQAACQTLSGLVLEMRRRYSLFQAAEATSLESYNQKHPQNRLPYIVCVIDELASLMGSDLKRQTEAAIQALAQESRACGIHLVVATQRPSVDVVTGIIKANLPARLSLRLGSMADSRTILDSGGAEYLRGKGDLYFRPEGETVRGQGAVVSEEAVRAVVQWWVRRQGVMAVNLPSPVGTMLREPQEGAGQPRLAREPQEDPREPDVPEPEPRTPSAPEPEPHPGNHPVSREEQELRWVREKALALGCITRRIVEKGLGIRTERAGALLRVLDDEGWLLPARSRYPRKLALSEDDRRQRLAQLRGCSPEEVRFDTAEYEVGGETDEDEVVPTLRGDNLKELAERLRSVASATVMRTPVDYAGLKKLLDQLDEAINMALEQVQPDTFHELAAVRRAVKGRLEDR